VSAASHVDEGDRPDPKLNKPKPEDFNAKTQGREAAKSLNILASWRLSDFALGFLLKVLQQASHSLD